MNRSGKGSVWRSALWWLVPCWLGVASARGNYALFTQPTDTIQIPGNTIVSNQFTIEARIEILSSLSPQAQRGLLFEEQRDGQEDKALQVSSTGQIGASAWSDVTYETDGRIIYDAALTQDAWHHIAFVRDGTQQRLYVDGSLVSSNTWTAPIANSPLSNMSSGGFQPPINNPFRVSFMGAVDTLRVSGSAEYRGDSFTPPSGDLSPEASTLLLYNFNEAPGSTTADDSGPNHWTGTLGAGYVGATSPSFVNFAPGDANGDGKVDLRDLNALASNWQETGRTWAQGDFNGDGLVDATDLGLLSVNWQAGAPPPPEETSTFASGFPQTSVPEPRFGLAMVLPALAGVARRRRRISA